MRAERPPLTSAECTARFRRDRDDARERTVVHRCLERVSADDADGEQAGLASGREVLATAREAVCDRGTT